MREAAIKILLERGRDKFTLDAVATAAQVNRTTLYRRWSTKERLLTWALLESVKQQVPQPNLGNIKEELVVIAKALNTFIQTPLGQAFSQVLVPGPEADQAVLDAITQFWRERLALTHEVIERAVERGELPSSVRADDLTEQIFGPFYFRHLARQKEIDAQFVEDIVTRALEAAS